MRYLLFILTLVPLLMRAQSPVEIADKICAYYKKNSNFEIIQKEIEPIQQGLLSIYPENGKAFEVETIVTVNDRGRFFIAFAASPGQVRVHMDDQLVFEGKTNTIAVPQALDDGLYTYEYKALVPPFQGDYKITITHFPDEKSAMYLWLVNEQGIAQTSIDFRGDIDFIEPHPYRYRQASTVDQAKGEWKFPGPIEAPFHESLMNMNDWQYHNGVALDAIWLASDHFSSIDYKNYVEKHLDFFVEQLEGNAADKQPVYGAFSKYFRYQHLDDFAPQTVPFLHFSGKEAYKKFTSKALNKIMYRSIRNADGAFARYAPDSLTIRAEDLYMGTVLLSRAYANGKGRKYLEEAIKQVILFDQKLRDKYTGLFWHAYFSSKKEHSSTLWARANGWVSMAYLELLKSMSESHPEFESMLRIYRNHMESIREVQAPDGRWYQVLDNNESFPETSATALLVAAMAEGISHGWLYKDDYRRSAIAGWLALIEQIDENGNVDGTSEETAILFSENEYRNRKIIRNDPRSMGAILYACIAVDKLNQKGE